MLQWTLSHQRGKAGQPARTYIQQLSADTGYSLEDLPVAIDDRDGWREGAREIRADLSQNVHICLFQFIYIYHYCSQLLVRSYVSKCICVSVYLSIYLIISIKINSVNIKMYKTQENDKFKIYIYIYIYKCVCVCECGESEKVSEIEIDR